MCEHKEEEAEQLSANLIEGLNMSDNWSSNTIKYFGQDTESILIEGELDGEKGAGIVSQIMELDNNEAEKIVVYINSPGGDLNAMWSIFDVLRIVNAPIVTINLGLAGSAAFTILMAGDKRIGLPHSQYFYHEPIWISAIETHKQAINSADQYSKWKDDINFVIQNRCKIPTKIWKENFLGSNAYFFQAAQALEWGVIDEILNYDNKNKITGKAWLRNGKSR